LRSLEHVVIFDVIPVIVEAVIILPTSGIEGLPEKIELKLGSSFDDKALPRSLFDLPPQNGSRRYLDELPLLVLSITYDERALFKPGQKPDSVKVRNHPEISISHLPTRELEPRQGIHPHVDGKKIDAGVRPMLDDFFGEESSGQPFPHPAPLHVR